LWTSSFSASTWEVDPALRAVTLEKLERIGKYASDLRRIDVDYGVHQTRRAGDSCTCEILVHLKHHLVKGPASAVEHVMALDPRPRQGRPPDAAAARTPSPPREPGARGGDARRRRRSGTDDADDDGLVPIDEFEHDDNGPVIVKTKQFAVKPMHPEEAALQMELLGHDFFLFRNSESESAAVLYRRRDGALGLIEVTG